LSESNKGKKDRVHSYCAILAAYAASAALPSQTKPVYSLGYSTSQRSRTLASSHTVVCSQSLPF